MHAVMSRLVVNVCVSEEVRVSSLESQDTIVPGDTYLTSHEVEDT